LVIPVHDCTLHSGRLVHVLLHMGGSKTRASSLCTELSLYIDALHSVRLIPLRSIISVELPFSNRILSSNEFLYLSMRHSSAAVL
jgi:hypothetical protein